MLAAGAGGFGNRHASGVQRRCRGQAGVLQGLGRGPAGVMEGSGRGHAEVRQGSGRGHAWVMQGIHRSQHCNWILVRELAVMGKAPHAEHDDDAAATKDCLSTHTI